ncbi:MAG: hypothetical protein C0606_05390 [Hyphomicrobiales bacterium]|nr:MAG: hypothetical protein C0606_05390 [Hyphomicrobiales bacterium]
MSLFGFALVLAAAFCHATWNFFVKRINAGPELVWLFSAVTVVVYLPVAIVAVVIERPAFDTMQIVFILGSAVLHLAYFLLLQRGYRYGDLSLIYPTARATGPLLSSSFAVVFLGEMLTPQIAIGAIAIIGGVLFLTRKQGSEVQHPLVSLAFGLATGCLIGTYTVWDAYAVSALMVPPLIQDYASSVLRSVVLAPLAARRTTQIRALWRDHRGGVLIIALFNPLAYILVLYALTFTPVVFVAPTREISVLITVVLGSLLLGEGALKHRLVWAVVILIGVSLLATAR